MHVPLLAGFPFFFSLAEPHQAQRGLARSVTFIASKAELHEKEPLPKEIEKEEMTGFTTTRISGL
jgi:hypothetical protein